MQRDAPTSAKHVEIVSIILGMMSSTSPMLKVVHLYSLTLMSPAVFADPHWPNSVSTFKGCGYCKWATITPPPPPGKSGMHNPGWPGCCRPPHTSEYDKIPPADWPAVHTVHRTPIPPDIKHLLDSVKVPYGSPAASPTSPSSFNALVAAHINAKDAVKSCGSERKTLSRANSSPNGTVRSTPQKARGSISAGSGPGSGSGHSPQMKQAKLGGGAPPGTSPAGNAVSPTDSSVNSNTPRRNGSDGQKPLKRVEGFRTTPPASLRRLIADGEQHPPMTRSSLTSVNLATLVGTEKTPEKEYPPLKRRASTTAATTTVPLAIATNRVTVTPKAQSKPLEKDVLKLPVERERDRSENVSLEKGLKALNISSGSSDSSSDSGSRSSSSEGTVTSDGGFTDYLSDESEAELQRQAELKAALLEQNRQEEQEFLAARRQLANVDLRPPQAWTTGRKAINTRGG